MRTTLHSLRTAVSWLFRWGEHATFAMDIANYLGVWKMVISIEGALLAALADWHDEPRLFWTVTAGFAWFAAILIVINCIWGFFNKWRISKAMASVATVKDIDDSFSKTTLALRATQAKIINKWWN